MKSSEKLMARLRAEGHKITADAKFRRLYPGHWQRSRGHWLWTIEGTNCELGSSDTVKNILQASKIEMAFDGELVAEND